VTKREVQEIVTLWTRRLGLERWEITIDWTENAQPGADSTVWVSQSYETATLYVAHPAWRTWTRAEAEGHVVHELVHLLTRDFDEIERMITEQLPPAVDKVIHTAFGHRREAMVELIARRFVALSRE
jgi:hypothetical protein